MTSMSTTARSTAISSGCAASSARSTASSARSRRSMGSDTVLARNEPRESGPWAWTRRISLRHRILAVNVFAVAILAGSIFYLDSFRTSLTEARIDRAQSETEMIAHMLTAIPQSARQPILVRLGQDSRARLRIYGRDGRVAADSWLGAQPTYSLRDPADEPWYREVARWLDNGFDAIVGAQRPPLF